MEDEKARFESIREDLSRRLKGQYNRVLPVDEMLSDRWKKGKLLGFGSGSNVYENVYIFGEPKVGKNVWIGPLVILDATGGLEIGENCEIGCGVQIFTHSTHLRCVSERKAEVYHGSVVIGNNVYIGSGTIILPDAKIGNNSIVGAASLITKGKIIPPYSVAVGRPAKIVGKVIISNNSVFIEYGSKRESRRNLSDI
jgi:acetyltransferase-like isoleucine patch superfamily enzyme